MTLIDINKFAGIIKKVDPTLLPPENGQSGLDFPLDNGALRAWKDVEVVGRSITYRITGDAAIAYTVAFIWNGASWWETARSMNMS
jgi:hypothetical protein